MGAWVRNAKPYLLLLAVQFGSAGMFIFAMDAMKKGMSHYVFIVYRNAIASVTLAPFAFSLERKVRPKMSVRVFSEIMALAFCEIILDQCFALLGMKLTSASFLSAVMNSAPSITFLLAVILKMEHMKIKEVACQAKMMGTLVTFGGTLLMALYKGPVVSFLGSSSSSAAGQSESAVKHMTGATNQWIIGTCFLLIGCAGFSMFYILQAITLRKYPAEMSLATWVCFVGALQSSLVAIFAERHHPHAWSLAWDTRLFAPAYAGIVTSGVQYYIQGMVSKTMGPVIVTAFNPLRMIIVTALACIILSEQIYLGSIIGAIVVVLGLYLVVWGKSKEYKGGRRMPMSLEQEYSLQDQLHLPVTATNQTTTAHHNNNNAPMLLHGHAKCDQPDPTLSETKN